MGSIKRISWAFVLMLVVGITHVQAQTFAEWWSQKKTQKKYLLQQIAALQVYIGYLHKGYQIVGDGLETVKGFTNGEFSLHQVFISSFKAVSPVIRDNAKVAEIIAMQLAISKAFSATVNSEWLNADNKTYVRDVRDKVIEECRKDLEELLLVISAGKVEMTDDERLERLDKVYTAMQDKAAFSQSFCNQVGVLIKQRVTEQKSINQIKALYEND